MSRRIFDSTWLNKLPFSNKPDCANNSAVLSVNSGFLWGPKIGNFSPVQNQPYCCDAPLEGNAKPPAKLDDVGILMEFQTSWDILTYTYHINQPEDQTSAEFTSVLSTVQIAVLFLLSLCLCREMRPWCHRWRPSALTQLFSQCLSQILYISAFRPRLERHRVMTCALTYQKNHGLEFFTDRRENIWKYDINVFLKGRQSTFISR